SGVARFRVGTYCLWTNRGADSKDDVLFSQTTDPVPVSQFLLLIIATAPHFPPGPGQVRFACAAVRSVVACWWRRRGRGRPARFPRLWAGFGAGRLGLPGPAAFS